MNSSNLNGSSPKGTDNVASLADARRRAAARAKDEQRAAREAKRGGPMSARDWMIGAVVMAMAAGMVWHWLAPLVGARGLVR
jgi:hypothetical protein